MPKFSESTVETFVIPPALAAEAVEASPDPMMPRMEDAQDWPVLAATGLPVAP